MNRTLLALAVTAALATPLAAQAAPTVYGLLNLSVDMVDQESSGVDEIQVNSNSSRLGVKGEEDLGNGYSAVYKIEGGIDASGDGFLGTDWSLRDRYLGLKSNWGTLKMGVFDSPLKSAQGTVDQFNDMTYADMKNYFAGENRFANVIGYESPKIADVLTVKLAAQSGEDWNATGTNNSALSASVAYEQGGLYLALAADAWARNQFDALNPPGDEKETMRLVATYTMDTLQLGAMIQTSQNSDEAVSGQDDEEGFLLSAAYTMGKNVIKGQVAMVNNDFGGGAEADTLFIGVGADHNFTQMTKAFAQLSMTSIDNSPGADTDDTILTVGMQTKF